eukprot:TRINITY_DN5700_c0_g2_i5.p1 TRINITY_DN5700_c0_g2~~TRINITY_DN5700_c0_g2_i5.p1  ORF type:complete len:423 (-),score=70.97 TRINITY_DN5700_c0_g2_i5:445-1647(-)
MVSWPSWAELQRARDRCGFTVDAPLCSVQPDGPSGEDGSVSRDVSESGTWLRTALRVSFYPHLVAAAALLGTPLLLLGPQLADEWREGALGRFGGESEAVDSQVTVTQGWTSATYPHPIKDAARCRNPLASVPVDARAGKRRDAFFCDPDGILDAAQAARVTRHLVNLQESVRVPCDMGSVNGSLSRPFFLGVALMRRLGMHYGEPEADPAKCRSHQACLPTEVDWFGDALLHTWNMAFTQDDQYCPNSAIIVLTTTHRYVQIRFLSNYFVGRQAGSEISRFMRKRFASNDWEGGLLAAADALQRYFNAVYFDKGYTKMYWRFMLCAAWALAIGLALAFFGHVKNQALPLYDLDRGGPLGIHLRRAGSSRCGSLWPTLFRQARSRLCWCSRVVDVHGAIG